MINSRKKAFTNVKGFTLVELVIVIAVVAILAAVLIPTFSSLVKKANLVADAQAVRQMNTLLATYEVDEKNQNVADVIIALKNDNIDAEDYKPLTLNTYFYWVESLNRVIHVDEKDNVLYPENLKDATKQGWQSLSGSVATSDKWTISADKKTATVSTGAELVDLMKAYNDGNVKTEEITTIKLTDDIDMRGANINIKNVSKNLSIVAESQVTISNLRTDMPAFVGEYDGDDFDYGFGGLIGSITGGVTVKVENLAFDGVTVVNTVNPEKVKHSGVIAGRIDGASKLEINNIEISNAVVSGYDKVGLLVGSVQNGEAKIENVLISNSEVQALYFGAQLIGWVSATNGVVTFDNVTGNVEIKQNNLIPAETYTYDGDIYALDEIDKLYYPSNTNKYYWLSGYEDIEVDGKIIGTQKSGSTNYSAN